MEQTDYQKFKNIVVTHKITFYSPLNTNLVDYIIFLISYIIY
jgi:hypothetical protein